MSQAALYNTGTLVPHIKEDLDVENLSNNLHYKTVQIV